MNRTATSKPIGSGIDQSSGGIDIVGTIEETEVASRVVVLLTMAAIYLRRDSTDRRAIMPRHEKLGVSELEERVAATLNAPPFQQLKRWNPIRILSHELPW
ncbi:MAG: hypothetical protein AB7E81_09740 [Hyphomicrobiaceae bacterium]